jgi:acetylornithine/N-succinyldiaminopimelate aminotransferase
VNRKAGFLRQRLEGLVAAHPEVFESVRGSGLMLGLKSARPRTPTSSPPATTRAS